MSTPSWSVLVLLNNHLGNVLLRSSLSLLLFAKNGASRSASLHYDTTVVYGHNDDGGKYETLPIALMLLTSTLLFRNHAMKKSKTSLEVYIPETSMLYFRMSSASTTICGNLDQRRW